MGVGAAGGGGNAAGDFLSDLLSTSYVREAPGTGDMRHGTEGWRSLETSFKASACDCCLPSCFLPGDQLRCERM